MSEFDDTLKPVCSVCKTIFQLILGVVLIAFACWIVLSTPDEVLRTLPVGIAVEVVISTGACAGLGFTSLFLALSCMTR